MKKIITVAILSFAFLSFGAAARAATNTVDRVDDPPFQGFGCTDAPNDCSLRIAIWLSNPGDTIDFASPLLTRIKPSYSRPNCS
jgi:hypothetical protein